MPFDLSTAKPVDAASGGGFDPSTAQPVKKDDRRLSEKIGGLLDLGPKDLQPAEGLSQGRAAGLNAEQDIRALGQMVGVGDPKELEDVQSRLDKIPTGQRFAGSLLDPVGMAVGGGAGKLATMGPKVGTLLQALKTAGAAGGSTAALTPGDAGDRAQAGALGAGLSGLGSSASAIWRKISESTSPEQRAALVKKALDAVGIDMGKPTGAATQGAATSALGDAKKAQKAAFRGPADDALKNGQPIPTQDVVTELEHASGSDVSEGKAMFKNMSGEMADMVDHTGKPSLSPARYEAVRQKILDTIDKGFEKGRPLSTQQATKLRGVLSVLDKAAAKADPQWKKALDEFKAKSPAVDDLTNSTHDIAGSATGNAAARDSASGKLKMPPGDVIDSYLSQGEPGMKAAAVATAKDPAARAEIRQHFVNSLLGGSGSVANTWREKAPQLVRSGLFSKQDATRVQSVVDEFDRVMTNRGESKSIVGKAAAMLLKAVPGSDVAGRVVSGLSETANAKATKDAREMLARAALDPQYGHYLSALPTPSNLRGAMTALQRAGAVNAARVTAQEVTQ